MLKRRMVRLGAALALFTACTTTEDGSDARDRGTVTVLADASAVVQGGDSDSGSEEIPTDSNEDENDADDRGPDAGVDAALEDADTDSGLNDAGDAALDAAGDGGLDGPGDATLDDAGDATLDDAGDATLDDAGDAALDDAGDGGLVSDAGDGGGWSGSDLTGTTVALAVAYPRTDVLISKPLSAVVNDGVEFLSLDRDPLPGLFIAAGDLDVSADSVAISYHETLQFPIAAFNGYILTFSSPETIPHIRAASVSALASPEVQAAVVTYDGNVVTINVSGLSVTTSSKLVVDVLL